MNTHPPGTPERPLPPSAPYDDPWSLYRLSWGAIFAGAFNAMGVHILLTMVETSFGVTVGPGVRIDYVPGPAVAACLASVLNAFASLWIGGWMAGRTAGHGYGNVGGLHGITVWAVTTTAGFILLPRFGNLWGSELVAAESQAPTLLATGASWRFLAIAVGAFAAAWGGRCGALRGVVFRRET